MRFMREAQKKDNFKMCEDCWGIVIIPNKDFERELAFSKANIAHGVRMGQELVPWKTVAFAKYRVSVEKSGRIQVSKFDRCKFCERNYPFPTKWSI